MALVNVSKWGNSIDIRFPTTVVEAMHLSDGNIVDILVDNGKGTFEKRALKLAPPLADLVAEMDRLGWQNEPETVDWGPDVGSERF